MRILHINDYRECGGAELVVARTIELQCERGHEVELFTIEDVPRHRRTWWTYLENHRARRALKYRLQTRAPHVVHLHNYYHELSPAILDVLRPGARPADCLVVMTAHDHHLACPSAGGFEVIDNRLIPVDLDRSMSLRDLALRRWDQRGAQYSFLKAQQHLLSYLVRKRRRAMDVVLCPAEGLMEAVQDRGMPAILAPYPAPSFVPSDDRQEELTIVFAGRIEREKGLAECLEIWPSDVGGRLRVIGDGAERERCERIVQHRQLTIAFLGQLPHQDAKQEIARAHVLLLPTRCIEVSPLSVHEALAAGTNVLVSDHGGCREIVEQSGVGFRFALDDADSLAQALADVRRSFDRGDLNSFDLRDYFEARSEARYIEQLDRIYADPDAAFSDAAIESTTLFR